MQTDTLPTFTASQLTETRANDFVRLAMTCLAFNQEGGKGPFRLGDELDRIHAADEFLRRWPRSLNIGTIEKALQFKAVVNPGTTTEPAWGAPLAVIRPLVEAFVDLARPASLIGKLMPSARRVPFNTSVPVGTSGGTFKFVGQIAPKPTGNMQLASATLPILKAAGHIIISSELAKLGTPAAIAVIRRDMIRGLSQGLDTALTDPTLAAVAGVSPASITNAAPSFGSAGGSSANALTDIKKLIETFSAANPNAESLALLMSPGQATAMAIASGSQTLGPNGGALFGVPVYTGGIGSRVVILDPSALLIADDGELDVTVSTQGTVELDTAPTSPPTAGSVLVSLWQTGLVGARIDRFISWKMARANAVLFTNTAYS